MESFKKFISSDLAFKIFLAIFVIWVGAAAVVRGGNDLKVDFFGAGQVFQKMSPYDNPTDTNRPLFRYAPLFAAMIYPFLLLNKITHGTAVINRYVIEYKDIWFSITAFYIFKIILLSLTAFFMLRMFPSGEKKRWRNFKIAFMLSVPFTAYELANNQNKLIALFFVVFSLFLFERKRAWLSGVFFNLALVVYVPLAAFILYFLKYKKTFIIIFIVTMLLVFAVLPSFIWGFDFNNFLLKDWFIRCLKPFFMTDTYSAYVELRNNSQSLPSAIGRIFVSDHIGGYRYSISPFAVHMIVRTLSAVIGLLSILAIWLPSGKTKELQICIPLILSLILPQYCIFYTWAYLLVIYFCVFNYISDPSADERSRKILLALSVAVFFASCLSLSKALKAVSLFFWATLALWAGLVYVLLMENRTRTRST